MSESEKEEIFKINEEESESSEDEIELEDKESKGSREALERPRGGEDDSKESETPEEKWTIQRLTRLIEENEHIRTIFKDSIKLLKKLNELSTDIIEMDDIKDMLIKTVKYYIFSELKEKGSGLKESRIHLVLLGDPGVGKTTISYLIADIYTSMGFLSKEEKLRDRVKDLGQLQDEMIRRGEIEKEQLRKSIKTIFKSTDNLGAGMCYIENVKKRLLALSAKIDFGKEITNDLSGGLNILQDIKKKIDDVKIAFSPQGEMKQMGLRMDPRSDMPKSMKVKEEDEENNCLVITREDLVGVFVGGTEEKLDKIFSRGIGKVIFIDEFYSICLDRPGHADSDGIKILNYINSFMDKWMGRVCFIFGGYQENIENNIFDKQPGLKSRIADNKYIIPNYSPEALALIYMKKMVKVGYKNIYEYVNEVTDTIREKVEIFSGNGRSMHNLCDMTKSVIAERCMTFIERKVKVGGIDDTFKIEDFRKAIRETKIKYDKFQEESRKNKKPKNMDSDFDELKKFLSGK